MAKFSPLAKKILELRKQLKMTQADLAQRVGVSKGAISHFEKGTSRPSSDTIAKLSAVLKEDLRKQLPHIGRFPVLSTEDNESVAIIKGNQYDRLKWDYLRRSETDLPDELEEAQFKKSGTSYAFKALSLPDDFLGNGTHIAYPINGNQMAPLFEDGDILIFTLDSEPKWETFPRESNHFDTIDAFPIYAVETRSPRERGLYIGRFGISADSQRLKCYFDDRTIPQTILINNIVAIWQYKWVLSNRSHNVVQPLLNRIDELEYNINSNIPKTSQPIHADKFFTYKDKLGELLLDNIEIVGAHRTNDQWTNQLIIDLVRDKELEELYLREHSDEIIDFKIYYEAMEKELRGMADKVLIKAKAKLGTK